MIYFYAKEQLLLAPLKYLTSSFLCTFFIYRCFLKPPVIRLPGGKEGQISEKTAT